MVATAVVSHNSQERKIDSHFYGGVSNFFGQSVSRAGKKQKLPTLM